MECSEEAYKTAQEEVMEPFLNCLRELGVDTQNDGMPERVLPAWSVKDAIVLHEVKCWLRSNGWITEDDHIFSKKSGEFNFRLCAEE